MAYSSTLKMEATCSSETFVDFQWTTRCYSLDDGTHSHWCENLRSYTHILGAWFGVQSCLAAGALELHWVETVMVACVISSPFYICSSLYFYFFHPFLAFFLLPPSLCQFTIFHSLFISWSKVSTSPLSHNIPFRLCHVSGTSVKRQNTNNDKTTCTSVVLLSGP
jgi:hypothetical protein